MKTKPRLQSPPTVIINVECQFFSRIIIPGEPIFITVRFPRTSNVAPGWFFCPSSEKKSDVMQGRNISNRLSDVKDKQGLEYPFLST